MINVDKSNLEAEGTPAVLVCELTNAFLEIYNELKKTNKLEADNFLFFAKEHLNDADDYLAKIEKKHLHLKNQKIHIL